MTTNTDPGIDNILRNVQVVAASEGGSIEFVEASGGKLVVNYTPGVNEECPECVPHPRPHQDDDEDSVSVHAPYITEIEVR